MKTNHLTALGLALAVMGVLPSRGWSQTSTDPAIPVGTLSAYPSVVQTGTYPSLSWGIEYPAVILEYVNITPPGTITPKRTLKMDVRVIGASVKRVWLDSRGRVVDWEWVPTEASCSINNSSYARIWYNTQDKVSPNKITYSKTVYSGQPIRFGGRYALHGNNGHGNDDDGNDSSNGGSSDNGDGTDQDGAAGVTWSTFYTSTTNNYNVVALKHGDTPPTTTPLYQQPTLESFLRPYLDENGKIKIGPMDVIYLMELTHTNRNDGGFDLQDLVLLVTFRT